MDTAELYFGVGLAGLFFVVFFVQGLISFEKPTWFLRWYTLGWSLIGINISASAKSLVFFRILGVLLMVIGLVAMVTVLWLTYHIAIHTSTIIINGMVNPFGFTNETIVSINGTNYALYQLDNFQWQSGSSHYYKFAQTYKLTVGPATNLTYTFNRVRIYGKNYTSPTGTFMVNGSLDINAYYIINTSATAPNSNPSTVISTITTTMTRAVPQVNATSFCVSAYVGLGNGTVSISGPLRSVSTSSYLSEIYDCANINQTITINATPAGGYVWSGWVGGGYGQSGMVACGFGDNQSGSMSAKIACTVPGTYITEEALFT
ncbi:MAG: hypothetical protein M1569_03130 [Candidatus Marsarchaeota archaeon]|nr:hypothetical protein [Candidatus Marsarchaeota archaeon]MCL5413368.1 hypothetical protein [Candidatus Marsarchaeota archaeon]